MEQTESKTALDVRFLLQDSFAFEAQFGTWTVEGDFVPAVYVVVPDFNVEVRSFTLQDSVDSGGILSIEAVLMVS